MKIIVDEYPEFPDDCLFIAGRQLCSFDNETCSIEFCPYLISIEENLLERPKRAYDVKD